MARMNCWEFKKCGRQPRGEKSAELGVCPASLEKRTELMNSGHLGGRACWAITGTLCGGRVQGTYASKLGNCMQCEFFKLVRQEEGEAYKGSKEIMEALRL
ncbi:MAG: hypothetical protein P4L39_05985 [Humidesulfovibrio sp.]|nr:hypothetical protein [Humidesulfovibrio sp.]